MTEVYEELAEEKVYINKNMNPRYPLMARAIYENGDIKMIIMLWGLSWEKMTLGQANFLTVVSYLIQNAVLRAQRYMQALEENRYSEEGSRILREGAFKPLVKAYMDAEAKDLAECVFLNIDADPEQYRQIDQLMAKKNCETVIILESFQMESYMHFLQIQQKKMPVLCRKDLNRMVIVQKLWRRLQYVWKNEAVYNFTCSESSGGCGVSYLEPPQKKRKKA